MKLTKLQSEHYPAVQYLISGARATGKSTLIAYAYLMEAINNQGRSYKPVDFPNNNFQSEKFLMDKIILLAKEFDIKIKVSKLNMTFKVVSINPFLSPVINNAINNMRGKE